MKIIVLGGFLGSGKTTVLMQFARYLIQSSDKKTDVPVVILENEISEAGVDNQLLSGANFTVENIFAGCICCTSTGALCDSVKKIDQKYHPDWLLIEATGMAYPDNIREVLRDEAGEDASILALADARRWKRVVRAMKQFVTSQLKDAGVILVNKKDLVPEEELQEVLREVKEYNAQAEVIPLCAVEDHTDDFWRHVAELLGGEKHEG